MRILTATLLLPVAFADEGDPVVTAPPAGETAAPSVPAGAEELDPLAHSIARLVDLGTARQLTSPRASERPTWSEVEGALDDLVVAIEVARAAGSGPGQPGLRGPAQPGHGEVGAAPVSVALLDLAIGAEPRERERLAHRLADVAQALDAGPRRRAVLRALVRALEPLLSAQRAAEADGARGLFERTLEALCDPASPVPPPFVRAARERVERLGLGAPRPSFLARDDAGNELRSEELAGTVTVLRFWSLASPASIAAHERDAELQRRFWDAPFELVGVTSGDDRPGYLEALEQRSFAGTQLFDGPISIQLADALAKDAGRLVAPTLRDAPVTAPVAFGRPPAGTVFVLDASGTIRGRDLSHDALHALVRDLVAEENSRRREERLTAGRPR